MLKEHDKVYIKKYYGDELKADTSTIYEIKNILQTKHCMEDNTIFEKKAKLSNGKEHTMYTYNIITKNREYYMEKIPWYKRIFCSC